MFKIDLELRSCIFFILSCIASVFLVLSFVSLGGANDADGKYPDSISKSHVITGGKEEKEELVEDEDEDEDEEEGISFERETHVIFFWYYTTAAVFFSIFIIITTLTFLFVYYSENDIDDKFGCLIWCFLIPISLTVVPAVRMDGFSTITYWVFFIPYLLLALAPPVLYFFLLCTNLLGHFYKMFLVGAPIAYLFLLTGLILYILRLDKVLPSSFKYTFIFMFPGIGVFCCIFLVFEFFLYKDGGTIWIIIYSSIITLVVFGGFFLPFLLRKDLVFLTSYHFTFIPYYFLVIPILLGAVAFAIALLGYNSD